MNAHLPRLGIDVGALYLKVVMLDAEGKPAVARYVAHRGHPLRALKEILPSLLDGYHFRLGLTGVLAGTVAEPLGIVPVDEVRAIISAVQGCVSEVRNIIDVGGGSVSLIRLNEGGEFEGLTRNSLCAAGTGSFLDEQAARLGINYDALDSFPPVPDPPPIATRCAVFAKSDLIHHQQAGRSKIECWAGLCRSMVQTFLATLLKGRPLSGPTVLVGGVALNPQIMRRMKELYGGQLEIMPEAHLAAAYGAAQLAAVEVSPEAIGRLESERERQSERRLTTRPPLQLLRSSYPSWEVEENYRDEWDNEVRITRLPSGGTVSCYLGIDIGSTSTKLLLTDLGGEVLVDVYRKTAGEPIAATAKLFSALLELERRRRLKFDMRGCVTTGSGRKMVGLVVGADAIINEITCHVTGAMHVDPTIDTIFEIGGQDSKYMRTQNGVIKDAAMNYVCAAGTGSFVEEVARKLGFAVEEVGAAVMGIAPPHTSDRCTVFMEQDVNRLLRAGCSREEALAAVLYSVVQNYLNKVVGRRYYSREKIFFQGATARNPGLVAAFENLLGVEMVVSPYAHVMGAWGAALLAKEIMESREEVRTEEGSRRGEERAGSPAPGEGRSGSSAGRSKFRGLDLSQRKIELRTERCGQCVNHCELTFARIEGETEEPSWGYMCGREPGEKKRARREFRLFARREQLLHSFGAAPAPEDAPTIALPLTLTSYSFLPLWRSFLSGLGCRVKVSPRTNAELKKLGIEISAADFCFPVKAALGHARWAVESSGADYVFIPHIVSNEPHGHTTNSLFCPYLQAYPSVARTALKLHAGRTEQLLSPVLDLRWPEKKQVAELYEQVGARLGKSRKEVREAWTRARKTQQEFEEALRAEGRKALVEIEAADKPAILIIGRPYNTCDAGVNLGLVQKIAERGHTVIPLDMLDFNPGDLGPEFRNLYWNYPQRMIAALKKIISHPRIFPVYFTNFNCGPDSFVETYCEHLAGDKPLLILGLDEHDADAGYLTRIEAFLDVVNHAEPGARPREIFLPRSDEDEFRRRTIWVPNMHPIGATLGAAAMRAYGYDARVLPLETDESFEIGRRLTSGNECLPAVTTIGALVAKLREIDARPGEHAFFMATAAGPCRFGQYALKHRLILNSLGYEDVPIMSPSATNSYQGLPEKLRRQIWTLFVASDILVKLRCRLKPYEEKEGETERVLAEELERLVKVVERGGNFHKEWLRALERLAAVPQSGPPKPLVGVVGEIYVRCNPFANDRVIEAIERAGGEAWLTPLSEWFLYTAYLQQWRAKEDLRGLVYRGQSLVKNRYIQAVEHEMYELARPWLPDRDEPPIEEVVAAGQQYLPLNFEGEAILTVGRMLKFIDQGAAMVVNCAPFGCMPGTITSALFQEIQNQTGVPVVSMFYDGEGDLNGLIGVYLAQVEGRGRGERGAGKHGQRQEERTAERREA